MLAENYGVTDKSNKIVRGIRRHTITSLRSCSLGVITGTGLERTDHHVRIVDLSIIGMGIESDKPIDTGFVSFSERVGGHKYGLLMWCKPSGERYRAGINFVTLSRTDEQYIDEQMQLSETHRPLQDPRLVISSMIQSLNKEQGGQN